MAAGNFGSPIQLLILLAIVLLLFGGNRLCNLGSDLGSAIKGFKHAVATNEPNKELHDKPINHPANSISIQQIAVDNTYETITKTQGHSEHQTL